MTVDMDKKLREMTKIQRSIYFDGFVDGTMGILDSLRSEGVLTQEYVDGFETNLRAVVSILNTGRSERNLSEFSQIFTKKKEEQG